MTLPPTHRVQSAACPACGTVLTAAMSLETQRQPGNGDFSVCLSCAALNRWEDAQLRRSTLDEVREVCGDEGVRAVAKAQLVARFAKELGK